MTYKGQGPENRSTNAKWSRPPLRSIISSEDTIIFQQVDLDFYEGPPMKESLTSHRKEPIFRLYGVSESGNSILAHLYGYVPYFYCSAPTGVKISDLHKIKDALNYATRAELKSKDTPDNVVLEVRLVTRENVYGFHNNRKAQFLQIDVLLPKHISAVKRILETGFEFPGFGGVQGYQTFESNIDIEIRFMADNRIVGCNWIEIPKGVYRIRDKEDYMSRCQLEIELNYK